MLTISKMNGEAIKAKTFIGKKKLLRICFLEKENSANLAEFSFSSLLTGQNMRSEQRYH